MSTETPLTHHRKPVHELLITEEDHAARAAHTPKQYHRGFREQVEKWPVHPLDIIIDWLGKYTKARVVDFGCGEARLAASVPNKVWDGGQGRAMIGMLPASLSERGCRVETLGA